MAPPHIVLELAMQQARNDFLILLNYRQAVKAPAREVRIACVEPFILELAAAEWLADKVPRKLEQLHPVARRELLAAQVLFQVSRDFGVGEVLLRGRHYKPAAAQFANHLDRANLRLRNQHP